MREIRGMVHADTNLHGDNWKRTESEAGITGRPSHLKSGLLFPDSNCDLASSLRRSDGNPLSIDRSDRRGALDRKAPLADGDRLPFVAPDVACGGSSCGRLPSRDRAIAILRSAGNKVLQRRPDITLRSHDLWLHRLGWRVDHAASVQHDRRRARARVRLHARGLRWAVSKRRRDESRVGRRATD